MKGGESWKPTCAKMCHSVPTWANIAVCRLCTDRQLSGTVMMAWIWHVWINALLFVPMAQAAPKAGTKELSYNSLNLIHEFTSLFSTKVIVAGFHGGGEGRRKRDRVNGWRRGGCSCGRGEQPNRLMPSLLSPQPCVLIHLPCSLLTMYGLWLTSQVEALWWLAECWKVLVPGAILAPFSTVKSDTSFMICLRKANGNRKK